MLHLPGVQDTHSTLPCPAWSPPPIPQTPPAAKCPDNLGIGGLRWRKAKIVRDEGAEWRLSGMALLCNR